MRNARPCCTVVKSVRALGPAGLPRRPAPVFANSNGINRKSLWPRKWLSKSVEPQLKLNEKSAAKNIQQNVEHSRQ